MDSLGCCWLLAHLVSEIGEDELNHTRLAGYNTLDDVVTDSLTDVSLV